MAKARAKTRGAAFNEDEPLVSIEPVVVRPLTAAKLLDCSYSTIYSLCKQGVLQTVKVKADDRILVSSIRAYISAQGADR